MPPQLYEADALQGLVERGLGSARRIEAVSRLRGGTKKGVYRLSFGRGWSVTLYVWHQDEDFWPDSAQTRLGPFSHASGLDLFQASNELLTSIGVPTPRILFLDSEAPEVRGDIAFVEDVGDRSLADLLIGDPGEIVQPMSELCRALATMRSSRSQHIGKIALLNKTTPPRAEPGRSCEAIVMEQAMEDLDTAATELQVLADRQAIVRGALSDAAAEVRPRRDHSIVHGELGPDHIFVNDSGHISILDIEGVMYFDVEWEHAFLKIRFPNYDNGLRPSGLDEKRLTFYQLAYHLSLVAGPLQLLAGDFPERDLMTKIMDWNLHQVLNLTT